MLYHLSYRKAVQNRIALDMLLAEKGGVCRLIGSNCCTFIPNKTAPDGSITRALEGLESLSKEWVENSGIDNPLTTIMEKWFGKWSGLLTSIFTAIMVAVAVLGLCGCCCIQCIRGLAQRVIETGMTKSNGSKGRRNDPLAGRIRLIRRLGRGELCSVIRLRGGITRPSNNHWVLVT